MVTAKKFLDESRWIEGELVVGATREDVEPWRGLVTFIASRPTNESEVHYTPNGYPTAHEALAAAKRLAARLFPPGAPREA